MIAHVGKEISGAEGHILTTEGNPPESVHIQALEWPDARRQSGPRAARVQMAIQGLFLGDGGIVVPGEELACNHLVNSYLIQPKLGSSFEFPLHNLLTNDRDYDTATRMELSA